MDTPEPALTKFLALVAWAEGTSTNSLTGDQQGYNVIVSGPDGPEIFTDYTDHPFVHRMAKLVRTTPPPPLYSTAAGRYQVLYHWWKAYKAQLGLLDFSPASQDAVAIQQITERGALNAILNGDLPTAIARCSNIWASFPGNDYAQNAHPLPVLLAQYEILNTGGTDVAFA